MSAFVRLMLFAPLSVATLSCSSAPPQASGPDWIRQPARMVDNGYIVYVGHAEGPSAEAAIFRAEGVGLEDLANECSLIPKGARVEDRYTESIKNGVSAYVKLALEFQECEHAMKTNDPEEIKKIANVNFTAYLKRYQDFAETGETPPADEAVEIQPPTEIAAAPSQNSGDARTHFFITRQYIAYQKEIVVLSPSQAFQPNSVESHKFASAVRPASAQVQGMMEKDPSLKSQSMVWSRLPDRPRLVRPVSLAPRYANAAREPHFKPAPRPAAPVAAPLAKRRRGRRRRW